MSEFSIGGQAVMEGVMIRSKDRIATAVRRADGTIQVKTDPYVGLALRHKWINIPIIRGAVGFFEMLIIGIKTLNFSADIAMRDQAGEAEKESTSNSTTTALTAIFSLLLGIAIFFFTPLAIASLFGVQKDAVTYNLLAGGIRLVLFTLYLWLISLFSDIQRLFQYHGAEHKVITTYEAKKSLTPSMASQSSRFHPRCGTSFILIVALLAILIFAIADSIYAIQTGHPPSLLTRFGIHFTLLPIVSGTSYELLRLSGKTYGNPITRLLVQPGLWLQRITTKEPNHGQLEVAIAALEAALGTNSDSVTTKPAPAA